MKTVFATLALVWASLALAQDDDYQLLRADPTGYASVVPGHTLVFPRDHYPHKRYRIEWWYLTANLASPDGREYGVQWTLFRQSMDAGEDPGGWSSNQVWMAHAAISGSDGFVHDERFARGGIGQAGVAGDENGNFRAWLDDWVWSGDGASPIDGDLRFTVGDAELSMSLTASTPWVLQGDGGYSLKSSEGQASYYYSQPHIQISATMKQGNITTPLTGRGWLDREWSSQPLSPHQPGWDWLSLHLDDGHALMVYRLRNNTGEDWVSGSWVDPAGSSVTLSRDDIRFTEVKRVPVDTARGPRDLPLYWQVELPAQSRTLNIRPARHQNWLDAAFPYWEGPVVVEEGGRGYLELTGH